TWRRRSPGRRGRPAVAGSAPPVADPPGPAAHPAVEIEEALAHHLEAGERSVAFVVEHGPAAVPLAGTRQLLGDQIERVVPRHAPPCPVDLAQRVELAVGVVEAIAEIEVDLVAQRTAREGMLGITAEARDATVDDFGHDATRVEAVERARGPQCLGGHHATCRAGIAHGPGLITSPRARPSAPRSKATRSVRGVERTNS